MKSDLGMAGKVALVTGACGGIGSVLSQRIAAEGASVILVDKYCSDEASQQLLESLNVRGLETSRHKMIKADILDSQALKELAAKLEQEYGKLDMLVNNAGITRYVAHENLDGLDDELIDQIFQVNWRGAFACVRAFHSLLDKDPGGLIVNMSSIAATTGVGSNVAYCASKAALNAMTLSLARALAPRIRVVSIAPGWVMGEYAKRMDPSMVEAQLEKTPLQRLASADDVANAVLAIASQLTFSTGCIIPVDGGRPLS